VADQPDPAGRAFFDYGWTFVPPIDVVPARTALLVIDMQYHDACRGRGYSAALERIAPGSGAYFDDRVEGTVLPALQRLIPACRDRGVRIVYVRFGSAYRDYRDMPLRQREYLRAIERQGGVEDLAWSGSPLFEIRSEIAPEPDDLLIDKTTFGAFNGSSIDDTLRRMGVETLVITGVSTNLCVETTARDAADRGYGVVLVDECTADYDERAQEAAMLGFHFNFGRVVHTADELIELIWDPKEH
jgi:nicotinamidase-related amidase